MHPKELQNVDDNIQLGPGGGAGRFAGWQRGISGGGSKTASQEADKAPANRFSALSKPEEESRSRYGVSPARDGGRGRGFGRPRGVTPRSSQEQEKERALAAVRSIAGGQTTPREGPSRKSSRGREPRDGSFKEPEKPAPAAVIQLTEDEMIKKTHAILDEYLHLQDIKEALTCVEELNSSPTIHVFVSECLNQVLESSNVARRHTGLFLHNLVKKSIITDKQYLQGLNSVLSYAEDMEIDIPKIWQYFGELIGPMVQDGSVPLSFLKEACQPLKESGKAGILVAEILHDASDREGHKNVGDLWRKSGLEWLDFVPEDQIEKFLKDKKLDFTVADGSQPTTPTVSMPIERIQNTLQDLVVEKPVRNEEIFDWIEANLDDITTKDKKFIRALMTAVCSSAITGRGNSAKVDPPRITQRRVILQKYLDHQAEFELQALYALQALVHKLEHPPGVLRTLFDTLYDEDIISEDSFIQWETSKDPAEQEGKGVAMKQVVQFFTWLREADDECNWVPRKDENNPKTIEQIHKEAQQEQQEKLLLLQTVTIPNQKPTRGGGRGGPRLGQSASMGGGSTPDGWNTVGGRPNLRGERQTIDPARLKLSRQNVDDNIQLGPGGGAGRFAGWQRGSSGGGSKTASQEADKTPGNRFSALSKPEEESRSRYGVSPARDGGKGRGFGRSRDVTPRSSQEQEKERALAAVRSIVGGQTTPREGPSRKSSRGREPRDGSFKEPEKPAPAAVIQLTEDEMIKKTHAILDEYLHLQDIKEALTCVEELNSSPLIHVFVSECLHQVLERSNVARQHTGLFLHNLVKKSIITDKQYLQGLNSALSDAEDMEIDIPKIWQYFGELIGPMVQDGSVPLSFLKEACQPLKESGKAGILVAEILHDASDREGHKNVGDLWRKSGLEWLDFVPEDQIEKFLKDKKLDFTVADGSQPTTPTVSMPIERIQNTLQDLVVEKPVRNEEIFDWIEANLDDITTKDKKFIRALMTAVCSSAITGRGNNAKVDPPRITQRRVILQKYLDHQAEFELQALYALQALVHKLEHPPGVLRTLFDTLYDEDIISEDSFIQWETSKDPAEQEGKGVAMKQVVQFFTWLREADDECNWVPRRDENNPKTIEQIHKEAQQEQQEKLLLLQTVTIPNQKPTRGGGRGGPRLGQSASMGGGSTPDGWNTVGGRPNLRGERQTIDPAKLKLSRQNVDDNIQLGPGGGAGRFAGWQRGSSGGGSKTASQEADKTPGNRFSALSKPEEESRSRYGVSPARDGGKGRGFGRSRDVTPRSSQEQEKERALAAVRSIVGGQTTPREGPSRKSSRGREPRDGSFKEPEKPAPAAVIQLTEDEMIKKTHAILDEYLHLQDIKEALTCVEELNSSPLIHVFVSECLHQVLERSNVARRHTGLFLHNLVKKSIITDKQYLQGLNSALSDAEDMEIDIPKIWQYFGELIGPMVQDGSVPLSFLKEACQPLKESGKAGILVAEILHDASDREGHKNVGDLWRKSGLEWLDFVPEDQIEKFLKDKKLDFTVADGSQPTTPTVSMPIERIQNTLQDLVVEKPVRNEEIFDWIEANLDDITTKDKKFIRALMTAVCSSAITGRGNSARVDPPRITQRGIILQKYLDHQAEFELQALYALQALVHKLEHPPGVLRCLFDTLYDEDIISEDAFNQWETSKDPAEQKGKGVAMKHVVQFFTWLREADDEVDS